MLWKLISSHERGGGLVGGEPERGEMKVQIIKKMQVQESWCPSFLETFHDLCIDIFLNLWSIDIPC